MVLTKLTAIQIGNAVRVEDVMYGEDSTMPTDAHRDREARHPR